MSRINDTSPFNPEDVFGRGGRLPPPPWAWRFNKQNKSLGLVSMTSGMPWVMTFRRWGMTGATADFHDGIFMKPADEFMRMIAGQEHNAQHTATVDQPIANLIASAPMLLMEMMKLEKKLGELLDANPESPLAAQLSALHDKAGMAATSALNNHYRLSPEDEEVGADADDEGVEG